VEVVIKRTQVVLDELAQPVCGRVVGILLLRDGGQGIQEMGELQAALALRLRFGEDEVNLCRKND
jgi:hypothetical protein